MSQRPNISSLHPHLATNIPRKIRNLAPQSCSSPSTKAMTSHSHKPHSAGVSVAMGVSGLIVVVFLHPQRAALRMRNRFLISGNTIRIPRTRLQCTSWILMTPPLSASAPCCLVTAQDHVLHNNKWLAVQGSHWQQPQDNLANIHLSTTSASIPTLTSPSPSKDKPEPTQLKLMCKYECGLNFRRCPGQG